MWYYWSYRSAWIRTHKKKNTIKFIRFYGDIANKKHVKDWLVKRNINIIFHLAAIVPTKIVKKEPKKANKWFFFSSTSHVYKFSQKKINEKSKLKPSSLYGLTKLKAEKYIQKKLKKAKIPFCIGRIFSFTHKKQTSDFVIPGIIKKAKSNKKEVSKEEAEKILKQSQNQDEGTKQASKKKVETKKKEVNKTTPKTKSPAKKTKKVSKK